MAKNELTDLILAKIKAWDLRKRLLAGVGGSLLICFFLNLTFVSPVTAQVDALEEQQIGLNADTQAVNAQIQSILADVEQSLANPNSPKSLTYKEQEEALDKALGRFYDELVTPDEMTDILREFVNRDSSLTLVSIQALPIIDILAEKNIPQDQLSLENRPKLFKRGAVITLNGSYFNVVSYLKKIEDLPKRLIWGELNYTVSEYPAAVIKITVYTLTETEEWIGG